MIVFVILEPFEGLNLVLSKFEGSHFQSFKCLKDQKHNPLNFQRIPKPLEGLNLILRRFEGSHSQSLEGLNDYKCNP